MNKSWLLSVALLSNATLTATQPDELIAEQIALAEQLQQDLTPTIEQPKELPTDAHSPSRSDPTLLEFEKQQKILRQEIVNLFDSFIPNFLEKKDQILLEEQKLLLKTLEKTLPQLLTEDQSAQMACTNSSSDQQTNTHSTRFDVCLNLLLLLCTSYKEIQAKTELLTTNLLDKPLTTQQISHLQINALQHFCNYIRHYWPHLLLGKSPKAFKEKYFNNARITELLLSLLAKELPEEQIHDGYLKIILTLGLIKIYRLYRILMNKYHIKTIIKDSIEPLVACEIYLAEPTLFTQYISIMKQYRSGSYAKPGQALKSFLLELEQITENYEKKRQELEMQFADENPYFAPHEALTNQPIQKILELFTNQLLAIKNELLTLHPEIMDPTKLGIWLRYQTLASNPITKKLIKQNSEFSTTFNEFQKSILCFISANDFTPQAVCEMVFVMNKLQKFLKYNEKSAMHKIIFNPDAAYTLTSEMASVLEHVCSYSLQKTQDQFVKEILTFTLIEPQSSTEEPMSPGKKIIVEAAQQITGQKFNTFRDVFLHTMCYLSPWLAAYVLSWALPYLGEEIKQPIVSFFAQQKGAKQPVTKESLTQLIAQNPTLLDALEKLSPELPIGTVGNQQLQQPKALSS